MGRRPEDDEIVQVAPRHAPVFRDEAEHALRALYPHEPGTLRLGMIAGAHREATHREGSSRGLGGAADLRVMRALRAEADAVLVGAATARTEGYGPVRLPEAIQRSRTLHGRDATPVLVIATFAGAIPDTLGPRDALILTSERAPARELLAERFGDDLVVAGRHTLDLPLALAALTGRGLDRLLCEGGPGLARMLLDAGLVDEYCLTRSPHRGEQGGSTIPDVPADMVLAHRLEAGDYTMERWRTTDVEESVA